MDLLPNGPEAAKGHDEHLKAQIKDNIMIMAKPSASSWPSMIVG